MNISALCIHRPIATSLLAIGLAVAGIVAFNQLPVSSLPQVDFPTIQVSANLPGADPAVMASSVATPLEKQLSRIAGITEMTSASSLGSTKITVQFDLSRDINGAARDVQAALNAAQSQLPSNLPANPLYRKVNPADAPILILALTSDVYTPGQMYDVASTTLEQKISQVEGVGQVDVRGSSLPAVRVELNLPQVNHYGINLSSLGAILSENNPLLPVGHLSDNHTQYTLQVNDQLSRAEQYAPLIVSYHAGRSVKLSDIAVVSNSVENRNFTGWSNGKRAVLLVVFKEPGANVIQTVDHIKQLLPNLKASIPAAMKMETVLDRTLTIRSSLHDVELTLLIAMGLVILVTYFFLKNTRAMLIAGVAVPLSLLGTFCVMYLGGFSLDNLSLMALTISTGFVIDDAVVMLENISRHIEVGIKPLEAALTGAREVGFTIVSMSLSLIAVFIPILLMGGIVGRLLREFSLTLSTAILISMLVSLTVTPMLCAKLLKPSPSCERKTNFFSGLYSYYACSLQKALIHPRKIILALLGAIVLNIILYIVIPKGFFPPQDTGQITGSIQADQDISFQAMQKKFKAIIDIVKSDSAVGSVVGIINGSSANAGSVYIALKPLKQRNISSDGVINRLRSKLSVVSGIKLYMQSAQDLRIGGRQGNSQFQYTFSAENLEELKLWIPRIINRLMALPGIADVNSDLLNHGLQEFIHIDRDTAARLGVTPLQIDQTLYSAFGQVQVSTIYSPHNQYHVVMEAQAPFRETPAVLESLYTVSSTDQSVPLAAMANFYPQSSLLSVNHHGLAPSSTLSFNLLPKIALGDAVRAVEKTVQSLHLPADLHGSFKGTAQAFQESLSNEPYLILAALVAVYIILGILYESFIHPVTILSTLPSAGVGALLALLITQTDLSVIALIGIILLIGIVKKNAIMMIDFALLLKRTSPKSSREAIYEAALLRVRPIMMTSCAALLGALPLVLNRGLGAELRQPLGIAIIGGLLLSQLLTLYTTPIIYLKLDSFFSVFSGGDNEENKA